MTLTTTEYGSAYLSGYKQTIYFLMSHGISEVDAEEAAQAAWTKGWEQRSGLRRPEKILSWINTIALNIIRNRYRLNNKIGQMMPAQEPSTPAEQITSRIDLRRGLRRCSKSERMMLQQQYLSGVTSKELGRRWNLKANAVRVRIHRAKQKLRDFFDYEQCPALPSKSHG